MYLDTNQLPIKTSPKNESICIQLRDSPGASARSTANIAGCTSKVGNGSSGLISATTGAFPKLPPTLGLLLPLANRAELGVDGVYTAYGAPVDPARQRALPAGLGVGVAEPTSAFGDRIESSPAEKDDDRLCARSWRGFGELSGFRLAVMSMLPPPSTARLSSPDRSAFSVRACSAEGRAPGTGVISTEPVSWA